VLSQGAAVIAFPQNNVLVLGLTGVVQLTKALKRRQQDKAAAA
jgi:hypothetical protein